MLLATRGLVEARQKIFVGVGKDVTQPLLGDETYWQRNYTPKMF
jgi:hypothetical protein